MTYRATNIMSGKSVALQVALFAAQDGALADRLLRAGRLVSDLTNTHIAQITDGGLLECGAPFLVTEWLDGCTLATLVKNGPLPVEIAIDFILQASEALAEMHGRGMVHRNLDPRKLFLVWDRDGRACVKLLGCAVAKVGTDDDGMPNDARILGPAAYRSPEELTTPRSIDGRADVWSLGVILFELVTRGLPFGDGSASQVLRKIRSKELPQASHLDPRVPPGLDKVLERCLQSKRAGRLRHMRSLAYALAPFGGPSAEAQVGRIRAEARAAQSLPAASLTSRFDDAPPSSSAAVPEASSGFPPTTTSVRPVVEAAPPLVGRTRTWATRVGPVALAGALVLAGIFLSAGSATDSKRLGRSTEMLARTAALPPPILTSDHRGPSTSEASTSEPSTWELVLEASAMPTWVPPPPPPPPVRAAVTPPPRAPAASAKIHPHPRPAITAYPEDPPTELFNTRK